MIERPILFSAPMVRALLDGSKTQTRRIVNPAPQMVTDSGILPWMGEPNDLIELLQQSRRGCPYGQPGDRLWVRETWRGVVEISPSGAPIEHGVARYVPDQQHCCRVEYAATQDRDDEPWRPSIHMPRWASRILLEIVSVHVERLQDISEADAIAEGIEKTPSGFWSLYGQAAANGTYSPRASYRALWESINGDGSWDANPWVWVVEFRRIEP